MTSLGDGLEAVEELLRLQLGQMDEEKAALAGENRLLGSALEALEAKLRAAQKRASDAEVRAEAAAAKCRRELEAAQAAAERKLFRAEKAAHHAANDRILLEQAERGRRDAEAQLSSERQRAAKLQSDNADLHQRLGAAQRQLRKLEELQPFAEPGWQERTQRADGVALASELAAANSRVRQLEGRCAELEAELESTAAALAAAQQLLSQQQMQQQAGQGRADSLDLSDLCDLDGAQSQFVGAAPSSPQRSTLSGAGRGADGGLPSRRRALQLRQASQPSPAAVAHGKASGQQSPVAAQQRQQGQQRWQLREGAGEATPTVQVQQGSLVESLQQQLQEQQRQLAHLQLQQHVALSGARDGAGYFRPPAEAADLHAARQVQSLQAELDKLRRRNLRLQSVLAEASLQHARAAAAAQQHAIQTQQEAAALRQQRDGAQQQLAALQAAAAALGDTDDGGEGRACASGTSDAQLGELLEYATRCNAAVEQNAALLQEKKVWLDKLRAAEGETARCREQLHQLRLQHTQLLPSSATALVPGTQQGQQGQQQREGQLVQQLLEAQAAEAALRSVLGEAREEQVAACKALSSELRRVHALERLRISDVAEVQHLQRRLHELQRECRQLYKTLAAAQQQQQRVGLGLAKIEH